MRLVKLIILVSLLWATTRVAPHLLAQEPINDWDSYAQWEQDLEVFQQMGSINKSTPIHPEVGVLSKDVSDQSTACRYYLPGRVKSGEEIYFDGLIHLDGSDHVMEEFKKLEPDREGTFYKVKDYFVRIDNLPNIENDKTKKSDDDHPISRVLLRIKRAEQILVLEVVQECGGC